MDPRQFHVDWPQLAEILVAVIILAFVVERALSPLFENRFYIDRFGTLPVKEPIAVAVSFLICYRWNFDLVAVVLSSESTSTLGEFITAAVIAGGSKASIKLFHDLLNVKSDAERQKQAARVD